MSLSLLHPTRCFAALRRLAIVAALAAGIATTTTAQGTTGVFGINDYTVAGGLSGSTSCNLINVPGGGPTLFSANYGVANAPVVLFFNIGCPCLGCVFPFGPSTCAIPTTACINAAGIASTNQSFDLNAFLAPCVLVNANLTTNTTGVASIVLNLPAGIRFSTQAAAIVPCATAFPALFSQAYDVTT